MPGRLETEIVHNADGSIGIYGNGVEFARFDGANKDVLILDGGSLDVQATGALYGDDVPLGIGTGSPAKLSWDTTDANANALLIQLPAGGAVDVPVIAVGQSIESVDLGLYNGVVDPRIALFGVGAVTTAPVLEFRKARGTIAAPTVVTTGDDLGSIDFYGAVAAGEYVRAASIRADMAGTIATTRGPGTLTFLTATDAPPSVLTAALTLTAAQAATFGGAVGISAGALALSASATLVIGTSGAPLTNVEGTPTASIYTTSASVDAGTSVEPFLVQTTMTGVGGVGGRAMFKLVTNVALGGWANALKAYVDRQTNGRATGLMSVICAEMLFPGSTIGAGTSAIYEAEIVMPASFVAAQDISVFYIATSGDTKAQFDTNGVLFDISGVASTSSGFWYDATNGTTDEWIRVKTPSGYRYLMLSDVQTEA